MSDARRDRLLELLPECGLPPELAQWLARGFETQAAGGDLLQALELDGADLDRRDGLIQSVLALTPGESFTARASFFLECLDGKREHPRDDMRRLVARLRLATCPRSVKHLSRVAGNRRQDGWRQREADMRVDLCPSASSFNTRGTFSRTGTRHVTGKF